MIVEAKPHWAIDVATGNRVCVPTVYRIWIDGRGAGWIGTQYGAAPYLDFPVSPMVAVEVEAKLREQLPDQNIGGLRVPKAPPKAQKKPQRKIILDDFN